MTHDARIEAMARAICSTIPARILTDWTDWADAAKAALAAAGVEEMVRAAAFDGFVQGQSFDNRVGTVAIIDAIVREVMGK